VLEVVLPIRSTIAQRAKRRFISIFVLRFQQLSLHALLERSVEKMIDHPCAYHANVVNQISILQIVGHWVIFMLIQFICWIRPYGGGQWLIFSPSLNNWN